MAVSAEILSTTIYALLYSIIGFWVIMIWLALFSSLQAPPNDPSADVLVKITLSILSFGVPCVVYTLLHKTPPPPRSSRPEDKLHVMQITRISIDQCRRWAPVLRKSIRVCTGLGAVTFVGAFTHEVFLKLENGEDAVEHVVTWFMTGLFQMTACHFAQHVLKWAFWR